MLLQTTSIKFSKFVQKLSEFVQKINFVHMKDVYPIMEYDRGPHPTKLRHCINPSIYIACKKTNVYRLK